MEDPAISNGPYYPMPYELWVDDDGRAWGRAVAPRREECTRYVQAPEGSVVLSAEDMTETIRWLTTYEESYCIGAATRKRVQALIARLTSEEGGNL